MLEEFVKAAIDKIIARDYAYLKTPSVLFARVTKATMLGETFDYKELVIHNDETGTSYRGHITAHWYEYNLAVVDRLGSDDATYPPLPEIRSRSQFEVGAIVSVALAYGDSPAIIGEVKI